MIKEIFEQCGFNSSEGEIYETILFLGRGSPQEIAKHSGISRENTYRILEILEKNKLVTRTTDSKKIEYIAENPQRLLEILESKENEFKKTKQELRDSIKKMKSDMKSEKNKPIAVHLQGEEGLRQAFLESIDGQGGIQYEFMNRNWTKSFKKWTDEVFIPLRMKRNIQKQIIITSNEQGKELIERNEKELRKTISIKTDKFPEGTAVISYSNKVVLIASPGDEKDITSIIITHRLVSQAIQGMLEIVWDKFKKQLLD